MKEYKRITEQLMYLTVKIENSEKGTGTGFFYVINLNEESNCQILITNKHVINNNENEEVTIKFHMHQGKHNALESIMFNIKTKWFLHKTKDICFCFVTPINNEIKKILNTTIQFYTLTKDFIISKDEMNNFAPLDELVMVGYPNGICNEKYNLPIFRKGYIASNPSVDFNNEEIGIVDMACFPGSSGSPIFIYNEGSIRNIDGTLQFSEICKFLGILFKGPQIDTVGNIISVDVPTILTPLSITRTMMNLGYYINGNVLLEIESLVKEIIKNPITSSINTKVIKI